MAYSPVRREGERIADLIRGPWRLAAAVLLLALFVTNIYRAATQSITHDEGMMFAWFLSGPWSQVLSVEHGNHHVLAELLAKLTVSIFGISQFSLRIPAVLGGLLYFYSVFRLSALLFGERFLFFLSVSLLSLNPFVLDYLTCARGYALALGFFFYALYLLTCYFAGAADPHSPVRPRRLLHEAGAALGLAIGCNPIMIFPGGALILAALAILAGEGIMHSPEPVAAAPAAERVRKSKKQQRRKSTPAEHKTGSWTQAALHFVVPVVAVGGFFLILPNRLLEGEAGYTGPASLLAILEPLVRYSFLHSPAGFPGLAAWLPTETTIRIITDFVVPAGLVALLAVAAQIVAERIRKRGFDTLPVIDRCLVLLAGTCAAAVVLIVTSRYIFQQPYPELRTAVYWIPLLGLSWLTLLARLEAGSRLARAFAWPIATAIVLCVIQFLTQFNTRYLAEWSYCAATEDMMQIVRAEHASKSGARVTIGATWQLEPVINFYRAAWQLDWLQPVVRESPDSTFDYYLLAFGDTSLVERRGLKVLMRDRLSGTVLAK